MCFVYLMLAILECRGVPFCAPLDWFSVHDGAHLKRLTEQMYSTLSEKDEIGQHESNPLLLLSHGLATVERGFSVNRQI